MNRSIGEWQDDVWNAMEHKGFHAGRSDDGRDDTLVRLCLIHSEVSEAAQIVKKRFVSPVPPDVLAEFAEELADVAIRLLDLASCCGVDLESHIEAKMVKNAARPFRYGTPHAAATADAEA